MRKLFRATAPAIFFCVVPIHAQPQPASGSVAVAIAPVQGQLFLESDPGIESVGQIQALGENDVRSGHDFVHRSDGANRPGSEQRSILWTGCAGLCEAFQHVLRRHRNWHPHDNIRVTHASASRPAIFPAWQSRYLAPRDVRCEPNLYHPLRYW